MVRNLAKILICALFCLSFAAAAFADGAVYAMTNALGNNQVLVFHRAADGTLTLVQTIATGGGGSGLQLAGVDSLGSSGSIQLDADHHVLFVVNAESAAENNGSGAYNTDCQQGTITSFVVAPDGTLTFADRVFSRGLFPNSLTVSNRVSHEDGTRDVVYVLNAGGGETAICRLQPASANAPGIAGFTVDGSGLMKPLPGSVRPIDPGPATGASGSGVCTAEAAAGFSGLTGAPAADFQCGLNPPSFVRSPAQIGFTADGNQLVATVKGTNTIYVFPVDQHGRTGDPVTMQAALPALPTYFGFAFDSRQNLLVTETFGSSATIPAGGRGALSSFTISKNGQLAPLSSHVNDGGTAACWIAVDPSGRFAYVANNLSASISSYTIGRGTVTLLNGTAASGAGPNDMATAQDRGASFLYVLAAGTGTVGAFRINADGSLTPITGAGGLPVNRGAQGLAAY